MLGFLIGLNLWILEFEVITWLDNQLNEMIRDGSSFAQLINLMAGNIK